MRSAGTRECTCRWSTSHEGILTARPALNTICSVGNSFPPATGIPLAALKKAKVMLTL